MKEIYFPSDFERAYGNLPRAYAPKSKLEPIQTMLTHETDPDRIKAFNHESENGMRRSIHYEGGALPRTALADKLIQKVVKKRAQQYRELGHEPVSQPEPTVAIVPEELEIAQQLANLKQLIETGAVDSSCFDLCSKVLSFLLKSGYTLDKNALKYVYHSIMEIYESIETRYVKVGEFSVSAEKKRILRAVKSLILGIIKTIQYLLGIVNQPLEARKRIATSIRVKVMDYISDNPERDELIFDVNKELKDDYDHKGTNWFVPDILN
jgi:hypothetical protein